MKSAVDDMRREKASIRIDITIKREVTSPPLNKAWIFQIAAGRRLGPD